VLIAAAAGRREGPPRLPGKLTAITVALQGGSMAAAGRCDAYADACTVAELCVREQTNRTREASVLSLTEAGAGAAQGPDPSTPPHRAHHHRFWQSFRQLQPHAMRCSSRERRQCLQILFFVLHPHTVADAGRKFRGAKKKPHGSYDFLIRQVHRPHGISHIVATSEI
jgi:hypothetical protein